jgi:hypothetical protein
MQHSLRKNKITFNELHYLPANLRMTGPSSFRSDTTARLVPPLAGPGAGANDVQVLIAKSNE